MRALRSQAIMVNSGNLEATEVEQENKEEQHSNNRKGGITITHQGGKVILDR